MIDTMFQVWPYLFGVYPVDSSEDTRRTQDEATRDHYRKLTSEWRAAEVLALKREQENTAAEIPPPPLKLSSFESQNHASKMAIFRKDSSLSNDVFESLDAPVGGTYGDEVSCRPETVVEESPSLTSPTAELAGESGDQVYRSEVESLPIKTGKLLKMIYF